MPDRKTLLQRFLDAVTEGKELLYVTPKQAEELIKCKCFAIPVGAISTGQLLDGEIGKIFNTRIIIKPAVQATIINFLTHKAATCREIVNGTSLNFWQVARNLYILRKKGRVKRFKISFKHARKYGQAKLFGISPAKYIYYINRHDLLQYLALKLKVNLPKRLLCNIFSKQRGAEGSLTRKEVDEICKIRKTIQKELK